MSISSHPLLPVPGSLGMAYRRLAEAHRALELRVQELDAEAARLERRGRFLVGSVRAAKLGARDTASPASDEAAPLPASTGATSDSVLAPAAFEESLARAEDELMVARGQLADRRRAVMAEASSALDTARQGVVAAVARHAAKMAPSVTLHVRPAGPGRSILHLDRVGDDEACLLQAALGGRPPSRHGFLGDDETEDASLPPPWLYPDEGVSPDEVRSAPDALRSVLREGSALLLPVKGCLLLELEELDEAGGSPELFRILSRGPVLEVERAEGEGFRSLLTEEEAERFTGHLIRAKLSGRIQLGVEVE